MKNPHKFVDRFADEREALDFIGSRIADEAREEGVSLSEVERKMLYFSETAWTLPDIWEVNDEFERNYERRAYERKISRLIRNALGRARKRKEEFAAWDEAIRHLSYDDRYLNIMVRQSCSSERVLSAPGLHKKFIALVRLSAVVIPFGCVVWLIAQRFPDVSTGRSGIPRAGYGSAIWAGLFGLAILFVLLRTILGPQFYRFFDRILHWISGAPTRAK